MTDTIEVVELVTATTELVTAGPQGPAGNTELGYAQITSDATQTGFGGFDVPGLSVTVTVAARPIKVIFDAQVVNNSASNGVGTVDIYEGSTKLANVTVSNISVAALNAPGAHREYRAAPSAGSHTYKIKLSSLVGNTTIKAAADSPAFIQVVEL